MPKNENQKLKLFRLLEILMSETDDEQGITMPEIILHLSEYGIKAERKSIYDDIRALDELGFEVVTLGTKPPAYTLATRIFELPELKMLVDAIESSKFITAKQSRELIGKLERFVGSRKRRELSRQVFIEDRVKTVNRSTLYSIDCIHEAINGSSRITFAYFDFDGSKNKVLRHGGERYSVTPKALVWSDDNYYLAAFDEKDNIMKNFRVDKMITTELSDEKPSEAALSVGFNPAEYSKKVFGMYGGAEMLVTLEFKERLAGVVIDRFGSEPTFVKTDFGYRTSVRVMVSPTFFSWVFSLGGDMRVVAPVSVLDEYRARLEKALSLSK